MILYHFTTSPFARRVRLALAHKGLQAELRDARADPSYMAEMHGLNPLHTVPVLKDGERVVSDSMAICHYLDAKFPHPPLWPTGLAGAAAAELIILADSAANILIDLGMRYHSLYDHPNFPAVREQMVGRAQRALDLLAEKVAVRGMAAPLCGDNWSIADIAIYTSTTWLAGLPARAVTQPVPKRIVELSWSLPTALTTWAAQHGNRPDVLALG
jgi:glutathione S-transferase